MDKVKPDRFGGILLIAGPLLGVLVMALHPTGHDILDPVAGAQMAMVNKLVHGLAIVTIPAIFLGMLALQDRLGRSNLTRTALVSYGLGGVAVLSAAVVSGWVATEILANLAESGDALRDSWHMLADYTMLLNQGYAKIFVAASSAAILFWSAAMVRRPQPWRVAGIAGCIVGAGLLGASLAGAITLDVHGFGLVTVLQSAWYVWIGVLLVRGR